MNLVKVCGITSPEDAREASRAGADAIGLLFAESPRRVTVERAKKVSFALPEKVLRVGVFVNERPEEVLRVAREVGLDLVQLHGDEGPETVAFLKENGLRVMKAVRVRDARSVERMEGFGADLYLLDAFGKEAWGGTGRRFDWSAAKSLRGRANIVVSGGLSPENVREAVEFFEPYGVDASSRLEDAPGVKNVEQIRRFVSAAKS